MNNISRITIYLSVLSILLAFVAGCSNSKHPVSPVIDMPDIIADSSSDNHQLTGAWILEFDPNSNSVEITPDRDALAHYNVWNTLPVPEVTFNSYDPISNILDIDLMIENPFAFSAYDLRLIVYTDTFGHTLLNSDDWTDLYDIPGGEIINPFKAYATTGFARKFAGLSEHTENLQILLPGNSFYFLRFAIDVSFPGNCLEPYEIKNFTQDILIDKTGPTANISIDVLDWQSDVDEVYLYCPDIIGPGLLALTQDDPETWVAELTNNAGASVGEYTGIIIANSANSGALALYDKVTIVVDDFLWVKTWGADRFDKGYSVATDSNGNVYITGEFGSTVDFGDGNPITTNDLTDAYLLKLDSQGNFLWVKTWGGTDYDGGYSVTITSRGSVLVTGYFQDTVDFGDGNPITAFGLEDAFLLKLNSSGFFGWVKTWGGTNFEFAKSVTIDRDSYVYVTGYFVEKADFGDGNPITTHGLIDAFLLKLDSRGNFSWVKTWGGTHSDHGFSVATDNGNNVYVTGDFLDTVDFGNGNPITSNGGADVYLLKLDSNGNFSWVRTWGGTTADVGNSVTIDSGGDVYVTGFFINTVDFGDGNPITSNGSLDAFLLQLNSNGNFGWVKTWGGTVVDEGSFVIIDSDGEVYVTGRFEGTVDFGDGNPITANGYWDAFLLQVNNAGNFGWVETWGSAGFLGYDEGYSIATGNGGYLYVSGYFRDTVDFGDGNPITSNGERDAFVVKFPAY